MKYELCLVLNGKLEEEAKTENLEKVKALIERFGGVIEDIDDWGKRRLAYEIQKMYEGYYYFITFEAAPSAPAEIERRIKIMETVLRYLIFRKEEK